MDDVTIPRAAWDWLKSSDTGVSSLTIWSVMVGIDPPRDYWGPDVPYDPDDFGRCHRLLKRFPAWRDRLGEVAAAHPEWGPLVREWGALAKMYEAEHPSGRAPRLYEMMRPLIDEGRLAAGWKRTSPNGWEGPNRHEVSISGAGGAIRFRHGKQQ